MKNIHVLPTDKPSEFYSIDGKHKLANSTMAMDWYISSVGYKPHNIYITSDEEIKEGDWVTNGLTIMIANLDGQPTMDDYHPWKKIILTIDQDLIKDGVQAIDDEFLEWFVKNPSCEFVEIDLVPVNEFGSEITVGGYGFDKFKYKIIIPKEEPKQETLTYTEAVKKEERIFNSIMMKQETLEEVALRFLPHSEVEHDTDFITGFELGAKWKQEQDKNKFSEEEVLELFKKWRDFPYSMRPRFEEWFEKFKKK
jgi:hypothetical protein